MGYHFKMPRLVPSDYPEHVRAAVAHYWKTLLDQSSKQRSGDADRGNRSAVTGGKQMIFDILDVTSGQYLSSIDLGMQNLVMAIDPKTGAKRVSQELVPGDGQTKMVCPHVSGGRGWLPTAYDAATKLLYIPITEACMDLVPVRRNAQGFGEILLGEGSRELGGITTGIVEVRTLGSEIRAVGRVTFDETRFEDVTVKYAGYIGRLYAEATGEPVRRGQTLFTLYSPELYAAQQEYLAALGSQRAARATGAPDRADYLVQAARQKLRLWDLSDAQIREIEKRMERLRGEPSGEVKTPERGARRTGAQDASGEEALLRLRELPGLALQYAELQREVMAQEKVYEFLTAQLEEARIREARDLQTVRVVDEAVPPIRKSRPRRTLIVVLTTALAFALALGAAFLADALLGVQRSHPELAATRELSWAFAAARGVRRFGGEPDPGASARP